jgi:hypothetical protein
MNYLFALGMITLGLAFGALALVEWVEQQNERKPK